MTLPEVIESISYSTVGWTDPKVLILLVLGLFGIVFFLYFGWKGLDEGWDERWILAIVFIAPLGFGWSIANQPSTTVTLAPSVVAAEVAAGEDGVSACTPSPQGNLVCEFGDSATITYAKSDRVPHLVTITNGAVAK